jgi:valyl-tRNA synthetase
MSKSVGNVVTPMPLIEQHGADALRYWAASGRPGTDTAIDESQMKIGRRLAIKMLNASKFVLGRLDGAPIPGPDEICEPIDQDLVAQLAQLIDEATTSFEQFDYARALERTESFFWSFCDDYVELVKMRAYGDVTNAATRSARATLALSLSVLQRLFAPTLPFVTDEVWHWWHQESIHVAPWPSRDELRDVAVVECGSTFTPVAQVLEAIRREKSTAKVSQRAEVERCTITGPIAFIASVLAGVNDLTAAGGLRELITIEGDDVVVIVSLAAS